MNNDPSAFDNRAIWMENRQLVLKLMAEFNQELPTEEDSQSMLYLKAAQCGLVKCQHCSDSDVFKINHRVVQCRSCGSKSWITAETVFNRVRVVRPYLAALKFLENGAVISACWFAKLLGIAASSAAAILKKLALVVNSEISDDACSTPSMSFISAICKRSRNSPAGKHPRAELGEVDSKCDDSIERCVNASTSKSLERDLSDLSESENKVYELLSANPLGFDILCDRSGMVTEDVLIVLSMLEMFGLVTDLGGNRFVRVASKCSDNGIGNGDSPGVQDVLEPAIATIKQIHSGCSRKCLQLYMALFWCHMDRIRWSCGSLLNACFAHGPIQYADIVGYVSPQSIKILTKVEPGV